MYEVVREYHYPEQRLLTVEGWNQEVSSIQRELIDQIESNGAPPEEMEYTLHNEVLEHGRVRMTADYKKGAGNQ